MAVPSLILCPVLIGRTHDRDALFHLLDELGNEGGKTLLISGEAGIGKSRLLSEAKRYAVQTGILVLQGNCFEQDYALPYAPLIDLLRTYFAKLSPDTIAQVCGSSGPELIKLLPELAAVLQHPVLMAHEPDQEKRRCFYALMQFFIRLSTQIPLAIVVEDLHWSDDTSLEFFQYFARQISSYPTLLILTYRTDEPHPTLQHFLATLDRERLALEFPLSRLSIDETKDMIGAIFSQARPVSTEFLDFIFRLTEGNPFFTEEILKSLTTTGDIVLEEDNWDPKRIMDLHIPRSVQATVQRRMEGLNEAIQRIITFAAVIGQRFDFTLLRDLTGYTDAELFQNIKSLISTQLVVEVSSEQFAFRHALMRQAIYSNLLKRELAILHQSVAESIERLHADSLDAYLAELAYHFYEAGNWEQALHYSWRAGDRASQLYALQSAIDSYTKALDAARQLEIRPPHSLQRARGLIYEARGDFERARVDHELVLKMAQVANDSVAELQALHDLGMLWASRDYTQASRYYEQALSVAQSVNDPLLITRSLNRLGNWYANVGKAVDGLQAHNTALELFQTQGDKHGMAATLDLLGMASGIYGDNRSAVEYYRQAIALFRELDDPRALSSSLTAASAYTTPSWAETTASPLVKLAEAEQNLEEASGLAHKIGSLADEAYTEWVAATVYAGFGKFGRAFHHAQRSLDVATEIQHPQWIAAAHYSLGQVYLVLLAPELAIQTFEIGLPLAHHVGSAWWIGNFTAYLALAYVQRNDPTHAEAVLSQTIRPEAIPRNAPERRMIWAWGELYLLQGYAEGALTIAEKLINSLPGDAMLQAVPTLLQLKGQALIALHRMVEAQQALEDAQRGALERQQLPLAWQVNLALGHLHHLLKRDESARREYSAARAIIHSLAATIDDPALHEVFLNAALETVPREKPLSIRRAEAEIFDGLTSRERQVAAQVAHGKSNREIAETLFLSERTIETHVRNILTKLGFTSRAQIAVWAVSKGLVKSEL